MRVLSSGTDAGTHVLYDPRAMAHRISAPHHKWFDKIDEDAANANAIVYSSGGDGGAELTIYVDEDPPAELVLRPHRKVTGHLKVPTGRLVASGIEYLDEESLAKVPPESAMDLAVGGYDVEAYDLTIGDRPESPEERAEAKRRRAEAAVAEPRGHRLSQLRWALFAVTLLPLTTLLAVIILIFCIAKGHLGDLFGTNLAWAYLVIPALWTVFVYLGRAASVRRYEQAADPEGEEEPAGPLAVAVLRRRSEPPEVWQGVSFGPAFDSSAT